MSYIRPWWFSIYLARPPEPIGGTPGAARKPARTPMHPEGEEVSETDAVADEEQAELRADVERLTRECLDREATETDARERLRQAEERLAAVEALSEDWDGFVNNRGDELSDAGKHAWTTALDELRVALRKPGGGRP